MKILVIESSPHKNGSSHLLASHFIQGASLHHDVSLINVAYKNILPCLGCDACGMNGPCIRKDDMEDIKEKILESDMLVFVTPLYYFGMSAQLKLMIDRFYSMNGKLTYKHMKTALIAAAWNNDDWTMKDLQSHYLTLCDYLHFDNQGMILGTGCGTPMMTQHTIYPNNAYELGRSL